MRAMMTAVVTSWRHGWNPRGTCEVELRAATRLGGKPVCERLTLEMKTDGLFLKIADQALRERKIIKVTFEITEDTVP